MTENQPPEDPNARMIDIIRHGVRDIISTRIHKVTSALHLDVLMSHVIEFVAELTADLQRRDGSNGSVVCVAGCSMCCSNYEVHASPLEVIWVADHINANFSPDLRQTIAERVRQTAKEKKQYTGDIQPLYPCPLLNPEDGLCMVYNRRPLVCRGHNSIDVNPCQKRFESGREGVETIFGSSSQRLPAHAALTGIRMAFVEQGHGDFVLDLTRGLSMVLDDRDLLERAIKKPELLADAMVRREA